MRCRAPYDGRDLELLRRRRDRGHRCAEHGTELHGGQADAAAGAQHDQLLAGLHRGDRSEHVVRGAVRDAECGGVPVVDRRPGLRWSAAAGTTTSSANAPRRHVPKTRSPTGRFA